MSLMVIDIEADGPIPGDYSMISFGAVVVDATRKKTFYREIRPISEKWIPEALAVSGFTREQTLAFGDPKRAMEEFATWIKQNNENGRPVFISDNNGFDWMFSCWYFHHFTGQNPFGFSSRRIGDMYAGLTKDTRSKWKHLRSTTHSHNPVDDAIGNAEVIWHMKEKMGLRL